MAVPIVTLDANRYTNVAPASISYLLIQGMFLNDQSQTSFVIDAGFCRSQLNDGDIRIPGQTQITVSTTVTGPNGLDVGVIAASTLYNVFVLGDSQDVLPTIAVMSLQRLQPKMPQGYNLWRRIGTIATDGSADIIEFVQNGNNKERWMFYSVTSTRFLNIANGSGLMPTVWTTEAMTGLIPSSNAAIYLDIAFDPATASNTFQIRPLGSSSANGYINITSPVANQTLRVQSIVPTLNSGEIQIQSSSANDGVQLFVSGFLDEL